MGGRHEVRFTLLYLARRFSECAKVALFRDTVREKARVTTVTIDRAGVGNSHRKFLCQFRHLTWPVLSHLAVTLGILGMAVKRFPEGRFG